MDRPSSADTLCSRNELPSFVWFFSNSYGPRTWFDKDLFDVLACTWAPQSLFQFVFLSLLLFLLLLLLFSSVSM